MVSTSIETQMLSPPVLSDFPHVTYLPFKCAKGLLYCQSLDRVISCMSVKYVSRYCYPHTWKRTWCRKKP